MKKAVRFDIGILSSVEKTPQGYLKIPANATRTGVFLYSKANGELIRELRHPDEVFRQDSMQTLSSVPVTNDHPEIILLDSTNTKKYMVGFTGESVERDGEFIKTTAIITDEDMIDEVEKGKHQVSCGYECELHEEPGVYNGKKYDVLQRNIKYNHLAIVDKGRAGPEVRLRLDSDDAIMMDPTNKHLQKEETMKIKLGEKEIEVSEEIGNDYEKLKEERLVLNEKLEEKDKEIEIVKNQLEEESKKSESLEAKADALEAEKKKLSEKLEKKLDEKEINKRAKKRISILAIAEKVLDDETKKKLDSLTDLEIKKAIIKTQSPNINLDEKSETYIDVRFDVFCENFENSKNENSNIGNTIIDNRTDNATVSDSDNARAKSLEKSKKLWQEPLSVRRDN